MRKLVKQRHQVLVSVNQSLLLLVQFESRHVEVVVVGPNLLLEMIVGCFRLN